MMSVTLTAFCDFHIKVNTFLTDMDCPTGCDLLLQEFGILQEYTFVQKKKKIRCFLVKNNNLCSFSFYAILFSFHVRGNDCKHY